MHRYEPQGFEYLKFQQKISEAEAQADDETHVQAANATATMQTVAAITPASEAEPQVSNAKGVSTGGCGLGVQSAIQCTCATQRLRALEQPLPTSAMASWAYLTSPTPLLVHVLL